MSVSMIQISELAAEARAAVPLFGETYFQHSEIQSTTAVRVRDGYFELYTHLTSCAEPRQWESHRLL